MAQAGVPLWEVAGMLGNSVEVVTRTFAKHAPEHLRRAAGAIGAVGGARSEPRIRVKKQRRRGHSSPNGKETPTDPGTTAAQDLENVGAAGED